MRARSLSFSPARGAVQFVFAVARGIEQAQNRQQRRLPAARRTRDRQVFTLVDIEVNARQRRAFSTSSSQTPW